MLSSVAPQSYRSYPLSPPPHTSHPLPNKMSFQPPQTPASPSQSIEKSQSIEATSQEKTSASQTPASSMSETLPTSASLDGETSNKRKRETEDSGEREQKKVHVEERKTGIEELHVDVGKKYLLCRTQYQKSKPDVASDLFDLLNLNSIAAKVARVLPNGEKNGLRKTYKGKIKDLAISGKFDVSVRPDDASDGFLSMMQVPEEEWNISECLGKEIWRGLSVEVLESLPQAMTMAKGTIPKNLWDSSVLGDLELSEKKAPAPIPSKTSTVPGLARPTIAGASASSISVRPGRAEPPRPKRNVKKRGYEESSYEGYGEGFVDDDMAEAGYSSGDGEPLSQKRRKKTAAPNSYPGQQIRQNSYGPGMVGA